MSLDVRQRETLKVLGSFLKRNIVKPEKYLDLGCGDGSFTLKVAEVLGAREVYGIDVAGELVDKVRRKGIKAYVADLNTDRLPFTDGEFDVVSAFEVIEHLWNTDNMVSEAYRVTKKGGLFILTTPNLASWVNRLLLLFGYLPVHYGCSLKYDVERRPLQKACDLCEHIRLYTFNTLKRHLEATGFKVIYSTNYSMGYVASSFMVRVLDKLFSIRKTLGAGMFFVAVKQ